MIELTALHTALLDLGLEDWIPLPEAVESTRFEGLSGADESVAKISRALVDLLREDRIQVWSGPWDAEQPSPVSSELAELMLLDHSRYSFASEANGSERVFYVNVQNFRG
jgi:hypothetical protein